jgi:hypothetical protein
LQYALPIVAGIIVGLIITMGPYYLFRDTMNKIQYLECIHTYWITRDNAAPGTPFIAKAYMRQTAEPYWRGRGVQFRVGTHTFQVGHLTMKVNSLEAQIGRGWYDYTPKELRPWVNAHAK